MESQPSGSSEGGQVTRGPDSSSTGSSSGSSSSGSSSGSSSNSGSSNSNNSIRKRRPSPQCPTPTASAAGGGCEPVRCSSSSNSSSNSSSRTGSSSGGGVRVRRGSSLWGCMRGGLLPLGLSGAAPLKGGAAELPWGALGPPQEVWRSCYAWAAGAARQLRWRLSVLLQLPLLVLLHLCPVVGRLAEWVFHLSSVGAPGLLYPFCCLFVGVGTPFVSLTALCLWLLDLLDAALVLPQAAAAEFASLGGAPPAIPILDHFSLFPVG